MNFSCFFVERELYFAGRPSVFRGRTPRQGAFVNPIVATLLGFAPASQNFGYGLPAKIRFQAFAQGDTNAGMTG